MKILIGMRGGLGDIVLFSSVLESFRKEFATDHLICGTSKSCENLARSLPFFDEYIIDFRPRFVRPYRSGFFYKDKRSGFRIDGINKYYCLDHPYRDVPKEISESVHIIDRAASILGVLNYERRGKMYIKNEGDKIPSVVFAPFCGQKRKMAPFGLFEKIIRSFQMLGYGCKCIVPSGQNLPIDCEKIVVSSILDLGSIVSRSLYFVGLDSGLSHIAASFFMPMSTIHIGYSVGRSGVLNDRANILWYPSNSIEENKWANIADLILLHFYGFAAI